MTEKKFSQVSVSKHAIKRLKERCGINHKSALKMAKRAFENGITHAETSGRLKKWINRQYLSNRKANNIRLYGDKAYIFCGYMLVTVLLIPNDLKIEAIKLQTKKKEVEKNRKKIKEIIRIKNKKAERKEVAV